MAMQYINTLVNTLVWFSIIALVTCKTETSTHLSCKVDYHGRINFNVQIPKQLHIDNIQKVSVYYWSSKFPAWLEEKDCYRKNDVCKCTMHKLTDESYSYSTYKFSLVVISNNTLHNFTKLAFSHKTQKNVTPWDSRKSFTECDNSIGTKLIALSASHKDISVHWIKYPLSVTYDINSESTKLTVNSNSTGVSILVLSKPIEKDDFCMADTCSYTIKDLVECSIYTVCVETEFLNSKPQLKCSKVQTYCRGDRSAKGSMQWQEALLMVFGGTILLLSCITFGCFYHRKGEALASGLSWDSIYPRTNGNIPSYMDIPSTITYHEIVRPVTPV